MLAARERRSYPETRDLPRLAIAGVLGAIGGALLLVHIPQTPLIVAVIVAIAGYVTVFFLHPDLRVGPQRSRQLAPVIATPCPAAGSTRRRSRC